MSRELADRLERDLSAPESVQERARSARERGAALDGNWDDALATYRTQANRDPKKFVRFPVSGSLTLSDEVLLFSDISHYNSSEINRHGSAVPE
jgi:hypothetical protein